MKRHGPLLSSIFLLLLVSISSSSCSFNRMAVSASSGLLYRTSLETEAGPNYELFKSGVPANLMMVEGLLAESPDNKNLLLVLTKGYAGYAYAVNETDMINQEWSESKLELGKNQALLNYSRAFNFGLRYLGTHQVKLDDLITRMNEPQGIANFLDKHLSSAQQDLELVLFTAQSLSALVNLQKDNISMVAKLPVAKSMFDWVCTKNPKIYYGICDIFYGAYESGRPKMLGGNPEKGKEIFLRAIEENPHNWLIRTSYMQYYLIPQNDKKGFDEQVEFLKNMQTEFNAFHIYSSDSKFENATWSKESRLRFYQSVALKRFELMDKYQKQFF